MFSSDRTIRLASEFIGQEVWQMKFDEISFNEEFEGIWACASLLHVPGEELPEIMGRLYKALNTPGIIYVSFKYGAGIKVRDERTFTDFTEVSVKSLLNAAGFEILECGVTSDIRPGRDNEKWVNVIARKI